MIVKDRPNEMTYIDLTENTETEEERITRLREERSWVDKMRGNS